MPTVICWQCSKPWMDTKHSRCPNCRAYADEAPEREPVTMGARAAITNGRETRVAQAAVAERSVMPQGHEPVTSDHVERIIALLERRPRTRVKVASEAATATGVLQTLAGITLAIGFVLGVLGFVIVFTTSFLNGVLVITAVALNTALGWGLLTAAAVVTGYVANRTE